MVVIIAVLLSRSLEGGEQKEVGCHLEECGLFSTATSPRPLRPSECSFLEASGYKLDSRHRQNRQSNQITTTSAIAEWGGAKQRGHLTIRFDLVKSGEIWGREVV